MTRVLFAATAEKWPKYRDALHAAFDEVGLDVDLATDHAPETVDYIVYAPSSAVHDFRPYSRLKAVLNLWAGVENVVGNETLTVPLCRMVDPGMTEGMTEWVVAHVMRHHIRVDRYLARQNGDWAPVSVPLARERSVAVLGLGELGSAAAGALAALNFRVRGWSRRAKDLPGMRCHAGEDGLREALSGADMAVLLLPRTPDTENLMNAERLSWLAPGAVVLNPGRGALIDDDALLAALDGGHLSHATLDVFRTEPLPPGHPFWVHPKVTVTPHVASETRASTAARTIAENIRRGEAGEPFVHVVDRKAGY